MCSVRRTDTTCPSPASTRRAGPAHQGPGQLGHQPRGPEGLGVDDAAWDHSSFSKNRDRLLEGEIAAKFLTSFDASRERCWIAAMHGEVVGSVFLVKKSPTVAWGWCTKRGKKTSTALLR